MINVWSTKKIEQSKDNISTRPDAKIEMHQTLSEISITLAG